MQARQAPRHCRWCTPLPPPPPPPPPPRRRCQPRGHPCSQHSAGDTACGPRRAARSAAPHAMPRRVRLGVERASGARTSMPHRTSQPRGWAAFAPLLARRSFLPLAGAGAAQGSASTRRPSTRSTRPWRRSSLRRRQRRPRRRRGERRGSQLRSLPRCPRPRRRLAVGCAPAPCPPRPAVWAGLRPPARPRCHQAHCRCQSAAEAAAVCRRQACRRTLPLYRCDRRWRRFSTRPHRRCRPRRSRRAARLRLRWRVTLRRRLPLRERGTAGTYRPPP